MSLERKIFSLFLLLILLIIGCVYTHLPQFMEAQEATISSENKIEVQEEKTEQEVENDATSKEEVNNEVLKQDDSKTAEDTNQDSIAVSLDDDGNTQNPETALNQEEVEVIEEPREPLLTTDSRYIREGEEKMIEELSFESQELQIRINELIKSSPIGFKRGSYKLTKESSGTIEEIAKILKENPSIKIEIAGHTDAAGTAKVNKIISLARANSVQEKLIVLGLEKDRMKVRGYGEDLPLTENAFARVNRRVEFNIIEE